MRIRCPGLMIMGPSIWEYDTLDALHVEDGVSVGAFTEFVAYNRSPRSAVPGKLIFRRGAVISTGCNVRPAGGTIEIGRDSGLAQNCVIVAANHAIAPGTTYIRTPWREDFTGVLIGDNVWVGANCTVLPGAVIGDGDGAVIGAGSVVTKSVPSGELWAGTPARFIRRPQ